MWISHRIYWATLFETVSKNPSSCNHMNSKTLKTMKKTPILFYISLLLKPKKHFFFPRKQESHKGVEYELEDESIITAFENFLNDTIRIKRYYVEKIMA